MRSNKQLGKNSEAFKTATREYNAAKKKWNGMIRADRTDSSMMAMSMAKRTMPRYGKQNKFKTIIFRASEMSSPAYAGHPLETFGQSDRLLVNNATDSANIMQALFLLNSPQINGMLTKLSTPVREARNKSPEEQIDILYLGFFSRYPTDEEKAMLLKVYENSPDEAPTTIAWAMVNSNQFLFMQ